MTPAVALASRAVAVDKDDFLAPPLAKPEPQWLGRSRWPPPVISANFFR